MTAPKQAPRAQVPPAVVRRQAEVAAESAVNRLWLMRQPERIAKRIDERSG